MQVLKFLSVFLLVSASIGCREDGTKEYPTLEASFDNRQAQPSSSNVAVVPKRELKLPSRGTVTGSRLKIGDKFPEFRCADLDGNEIAFDRSTFGERYTLVVFWSMRLIPTKPLRYLDWKRMD